jgi:hypothetical protein
MLVFYFILVAFFLFHPAHYSGYCRIGFDLDWTALLLGSTKLSSPASRMVCLDHVELHLGLTGSRLTCTKPYVVTTNPVCLGRVWLMMP